MNCLDKFIINIPKKVQDTKKIGDVEIYIETKFNEFEHRIPYGEVVSVPLKYKTPVKVGDILYIHHHVIQEPYLHYLQNFRSHRNCKVYNYDVFLLYYLYL